MEPVSTLVLVASVIATTSTARPRWDVQRSDLTQTNTEMVLSKPVTTNVLIIPSTKSATAPTAPTVSTIYSNKDKIYAELVTFLPDYAAGDPAIVSNERDIVIAIKFIRALPSEIKLPTLMRNDEGVIGMYWDNDDTYIDINIDEDGTLSMYSRVRSTDEEKFIDELKIDEIDSEWAYENLGALANDYVLV